MADHGSDPGPVFIDVYGTSRRLGLEQPSDLPNGTHGFEGPHPDGPFWKRGLTGKMPLWVAFWGAFFFGHGIVLAFSVGALLFGTVVGIAADPSRVNESFVAAWTVGILIGGVLGTFTLWSVISVWRCAWNVDERKWGYAARTIVAGYVAVWATVIWNITV